MTFSSCAKAIYQNFLTLVLPLFAEAVGPGVPSSRGSRATAGITFWVLGQSNFNVLSVQFFDGI